MAEEINQRFNHNYTDCLGVGCDCRADCIHYMAYVEATQLGISTKHQDKCNNKNINYVRVTIEKVKKKN